MRACPLRTAGAERRQMGLHAVGIGRGRRQIQIPLILAPGVSVAAFLLEACGQRQIARRFGRGQLHSLLEHRNRRGVVALFLERSREVALSGRIGRVQAGGDSIFTGRTLPVLSLPESVGQVEVVRPVARAELRSAGEANELRTRGFSAAFLFGVERRGGPERDGRRRGSDSSVAAGGTVDVAWAWRTYFWRIGR